MRESKAPILENNPETMKSSEVKKEEAHLEETNEEVKKVEEWNILMINLSDIILCLFDDWKSGWDSSIVYINRLVVPSIFFLNQKNISLP